jgi:ATP-dependent Lhr-like helicase
MLGLVRRYARTHGPFPTRQLADRYATDPLPALRELEAAGELVRGELLPGGTEREWCDADVLRRVRRASLARLRKEVEAADRSQLARFLPSWQNVDVHRASGAGPDRLREALIPLQGVALTPKTWERDVLPRRLGSYSPTWLDELCTSGELVWIGAGSLGRSDGKVALYVRRAPARGREGRPEGRIARFRNPDGGRPLVPAPDRTVPSGQCNRRRLHHLQRHHGAEGRARGQRGASGVRAGDCPHGPYAPDRVR